MATAMVQKLEAWGESIDNSTADQKTQELLKVWFDMFPEVAGTALKSSKIAETVKGIILGENTNFRCQTNVDFFAEEIASKLKDPTSNEPVDLIEKRLYADWKDEN